MEPARDRWQVLRGGPDEQRNTQSTPEEERVGLITRVLIRIAAMRARDVATPRDRVLFATAGFFIWAFSLYVFAAFGSMFVRITPGSSSFVHGLGLLGAGIIALVIAAF